MKLPKLYAFILLSAFPFLKLMTQPTATIISDVYSVCSDETVNIKLLLEGIQPFALRYSVKSKALNTTSERSDIYVDLDRIFEFSYRIGSDEDETVEIRLLQIKENNADWIDIQGQPTLYFPVFKKPVPKILLPDNKCGYTATLRAQDNNLKQPSYLWETLDGGNLTTPNSIATPFSTNTAGDYTIRLTETNGACKAVTEAELKILGTPKGSISGSTIICTASENSDPKQLPITLNFSGNAPFHYTLSENTSGSSVLASKEIILQPQAAGEVLIAHIKDGFGCEATVADRTGKAVITDRLPKPNAGADNNVCSNEGELTASISTTGNYGRWSFKNPADGVFIGSANAENILVRTNRNGAVEMRWTEINDNGVSECPAHDYATIQFDLPVEEAFAGNDSVIYMSKKYDMTARMKSWEHGTWAVLSGGSSIADLYNPNAEVTDLIFGHHSFKWTVANGICPSMSSTFNLEVRQMISPNAFSPNDDGVNDVLVILGAPYIANNQLVVFSLKGEIVYKKSGYDNSWNGRDMNNKILPDGFYYYIFTGDNISPVKETLVIKRSKP